MLPGIGRSTANSIATFCFGAHAPILDGNAKRVLCRAFGIEGYPAAQAVEKRLWELAVELMPKRDAVIYNQAQMDLGAKLCTRGKPRCEPCPLNDICIAKAAGRIAELPQPKPKRAVPLREATLLVLRDGDRVLLEARPPVGIWGGMLSLPELPERTDPAQWVAQRYACSVTAVSPAPTFVHAFSHFRLSITPLLIDVMAPSVAAEPGWQWLPTGDAVKAALPAPVRRILIDSIPGPSPGE